MSINQCTNFFGLWVTRQIRRLIIFKLVVHIARGFCQDKNISFIGHGQFHLYNANHLMFFCLPRCKEYIGLILGSSQYRLRKVWPSLRPRQDVVPFFWFPSLQNQCITLWCRVLSIYVYTYIIAEFPRFASITDRKLTVYWLLRPTYYKVCIA